MISKLPPFVDQRLVGFLIIPSKVSDILGRKPVILLTVFLVTVFSATYGAAQTFEFSKG